MDEKKRLLLSAIAKRVGGDAGAIIDKQTDLFDVLGGKAQDVWRRIVGDKREAEDILRDDEGYRTRAYADTRLNPTIGIGHKMSTDEMRERGAGQWSPKRIDKTFMNDMAQAKNVARGIMADKGIDPDDLPLGMEEEFMMMAFQMGKGSKPGKGLSSFTQMWQGVKDEDWEKVKREMKKSEWYGQTTKRAERAIRRVGQKT